MAKNTPPPHEWTPQEQQELQDFLDSFKSGWPDLGHTEPGFAEHGIHSPTDPTLIAEPGEQPKKGGAGGGEQIPHPGVETGGRPPGGSIGRPAGPQDIGEILEEMYGRGGPGFNSRPLPGVMPRGGPLINTPLQGLPLSNVSLHGLPGGPLINRPITGPSTGGLSIQAPGKGLSLADLLAFKARVQAEAHGHGIVQRQMVA